MALSPFNAIEKYGNKLTDAMSHAGEGRRFKNNKINDLCKTSNSVSAKYV